MIPSPPSPRRYKTPSPRSRYMRRSSSRFVESVLCRATSRSSRHPLLLLVLVLRRLSTAIHRTSEMASAQDVPRRGRLLGGVQDAPAGRENDLEAIELARFAVAEHNSKANAVMEFERLVKVRQQVVAGCMHYFTIEVKEGGAKKLYEAKVWEKARENFKQLQDFKPVETA